MWAKMDYVFRRLQKDFSKSKPTFKQQSMGLLILIFFTSMSSPSTSEEINRCTSEESCGKCIEEDPRCAWCSDENFTGPRCNYVANLTKCNNIENPNTTVILEKDSPLTNKKIGATGEDAVQIKPQEIRINLRPNSPKTFLVHFRQAEDYPVDLYYVMDLSHSMKDDKEKLAVLGNKFAEEMESITSNFKLGFGSFVDKVVAPYVAVHPNMIREPCKGCAKPYGFRNHMSLSSETKKFADEVRNSSVSGNLDSPEGTMDAIMQAVVCEREIGWRNRSRKLLVVSTDNDYHYAGDGKLGGVIEPNDCLCHLDSNGFYNKSREQDYPSLSQINRKIKEKNVNLIFAVTKDQVERYTNLTKRLVGSTTGELADDSSNVVGLIRRQYEAIRSAIEMRDNAPKNIEVTYHSSCLGEENRQTNVCKGLKVLQNVTFAVTVKFLSCPVDKKDWITSFNIMPVGLNEYLKVHLEMICECDCEKPENEEPNSPRCSSGNGTYECGVCSCNEYRYGKTCECGSSGSQSFINDAACRSSDDGRLCSNRGECRCGKCFCNPRDNLAERYYGKYCECDNFSCDQVDQKICNGHGTCNCGRCVCDKGWRGSDCTCKDNEEDCIDIDGNICGGRGKCECGSCKCEDTYYGQYCDDCPSCQGKCVEYGDCVKCFLSRKDQQLTGEGCSGCDNTVVELVDLIEVNETQMERSCSFKDNEGCYGFYKYRMDDKNRALIYAQNVRKCPEPAPVLAIVSGTAGSIVAAGVILLLIWKLLTTVHDRRELAKFEEERKRAKWDSAENPIYVQATSTFQNPAYKGGN